MPKAQSGRDQPESGQAGQNPDRISSDPDEKSQNPDNNTLWKPLKVPFEDSIENTLKSSGEAGSFYEHDEISFGSWDKPIYLNRPKDLPYAFVGKEELRRAKVDSGNAGGVIMQPDDLSLPEFIMSLKGDYHDVVTLDDLEHESVGKINRGIVSEYDWKHVTQECEHHGVLFDPDDAKSWWLVRIVKDFITGQDAEMIRYAVEKHDPDFTLRAMASAFLVFYSRQTGHFEKAGFTDEQLKILGFYAGLELLAASIQNAWDLIPSDTLRSGLGWEAVEAVCDEILAIMAKTETGRIGALKDLALERHAKRRESFVWGGEDDRAWNSKLPSASKAKLFMKAVSQLKAAGVPMTIPVVDKERNIVAACVPQFHDIRTGKGDIDRVAKLFAKRPWLSAHKLFEGFRAYVGMFVKGSKLGNSFMKTRFYCTKMASVSWFVAHLDHIAKELWGDYGDRYLRLVSSD